MRLGVLPVLVAAPLILAACSGDDEEPVLPDGGGGAGVRVLDETELVAPFRES